MADTIPWAGSVPYGKQANDINNYMTNAAIQPFVQNLPGYANMIGKRSENTQALLNGQLPEDVIGQIGQQSAERGIGGGQAGGPNSNAAYLRALGLTSLDAQQQGSQQLSQSIADTPTPELFNPASLWIPSVLGQQQQNAAIAGQNNAYALQQRTNQDAIRKAQAAAWNLQSKNASGFNSYGKPYSL